MDISLDRYIFIDNHAHSLVKEGAYLELSLAVSLAAPYATSMISQDLSQAPTTKILAGTDGHSIPETHWWGAVVWKESLSQALSSLVNSRYLSAVQAEEIAAHLLHGNARTLYHLDDLT